jgi:hypothetical protein
MRRRYMQHASEEDGTGTIDLLSVRLMHTQGAVDSEGMMAGNAFEGLRFSRRSFMKHAVCGDVTARGT